MFDPILNTILLHAVILYTGNHHMRKINEQVHGRSINNLIGNSTNTNVITKQINVYDIYLKQCS